MRRAPVDRGENYDPNWDADQFRLKACTCHKRAVPAAAFHGWTGLPLWQSESSAFADSLDEAAGRYRGLHCGQQVVGLVNILGGVLVKPDVTARQ
jgi:hypothetical protein